MGLKIIPLQGVGHMDEIFMMFPNQFYSALTVPDDIRVSKTLLDLWTTFASNGYLKIYKIDSLE